MQSSLPASGSTASHSAHTANGERVWRVHDFMGYKCAGCKKHFSVRTGTVMECSRLPLGTWLPALYSMTIARKGISSVQLAKELGITQKSAWFLQQRIRAACADHRNPMTGEVEVDEACFGGKGRNKHDDKKNGRGPWVLWGNRLWWA